MKVLVIYKKSAYRQYVKERHNAHLAALIRKRDPAVKRIVLAHQAHESTLEETEQALKRLGVKAVFRYRGDQGLVNEADLVVSVGGDGTLLWAARFCGPRIPVLAINSAPEDSVGFYCAGIKGKVFQSIEAALLGKLPETHLQRMEVRVDKVILTQRVLNDALFCHSNPGATSRYVMTVPGFAAEQQKSSGLWVGPAAGSTAAQRSAGGKVLPIRSTKLQFVVREPYSPPGGAYEHRRGLLDGRQCLKVLNKMRDARLYLDGHHHMHELLMGQVLEFRRSSESLRLLGKLKR